VGTAHRPSANDQDSIGGRGAGVLVGGEDRRTRLGQGGVHVAHVRRHGVNDPVGQDLAGEGHALGEATGVARRDPYGAQVVAQVVPPVSAKVTTATVHVRRQGQVVAGRPVADLRANF